MLDKKSLFNAISLELCTHLDFQPITYLALFFLYFIVLNEV